jgi:hypothetical protein
MRNWIQQQAWLNMQHITSQHSSIQNNTALHCTALHNTTQHWGLYKAQYSPTHQYTAQHTRHNNATKVR